MSALADKIAVEHSEIKVRFRILVVAARAIIDQLLLLFLEWPGSPMPGEKASRPADCIRHGKRRPKANDPAQNGVRGFHILRSL